MTQFPTELGDYSDLAMLQQIREVLTGVDFYNLPDHARLTVLTGMVQTITSILIFREQERLAPKPPEHPWVIYQTSLWTRLRRLLRVKWSERPWHNG